MPLQSFTILYIIGSIALFALGISVGLLAQRKSDKVSRRHLQIAVAIVITIVWVASITAEILIPTYTVSVVVHGIMGAVVGYLFSEEGITFNIGK